jgi:hypothetical protein
MSAVLPHVKMGPVNKQVATLIFGGQLVQPNTQAYGGTDYTVTPATAASVSVLGVAGKDANVVSTQTGAANTYGEPQIDISILDDYTSVYYGGIDILCWYSAQCYEGALLMAGANGTVTPFTGTTYSQIVGRCTINGGVASGSLTQQIGGLGGASYFLGRARIF